MLRKLPRGRFSHIVAAVALSGGLYTACPARYGRGKRQPKQAIGVTVVEALHALAP